jgi:hypothetical protein
MLVFKGRVVGPNLRFDTTELNFRSVSFGFSSTTTFSILNNSKIPVNYDLRIENDKKEEVPEFSVSSKVGLIPELTTKSFELTFSPNKIQKYNCSLIVNLMELSGEAIRLPIKAISVVPDVSLMYLIADCASRYKCQPWRLLPQS